jgi:tetratricopeptide (TPR) repeat protein
MTPDERTEAEARADRALRRGELSAALELYQAIVKAFPKDDIIAMKLQRVRETLQPMELQHAKFRAAPEPQAPISPGNVEAAEALAAKGDYAGAISLYRKALDTRPDSELIKERLGELFQLAQSIAPRSTPRPPPPVDRSEPPATTEAEVPVSSPRLLSDLLDQIGRRRRGGPEKG